MPTIHENQIERLERLLHQSDPPVSPPISSEKSLPYLKFLALGSVVFAICVATNPNITMMAVGALIVISLLLLNHSVQKNNPSPPSLSKGVRNLSLFGMFVATVAALAASWMSTAPQALSGLPFMPDNAQPDENIGTTVVGDKLPGLSLTKSIVTGHADADSVTSAMYMTMVFGNKTGIAKEARARIALPPDAVVSRVTLWINGVEQEAAFNSTERVRTAYQWITRTRRDPLLVTETGKGEVCLQAFPVPAYGVMKVRIGVTAPLEVKSPRDFQLTLPRVVSSNFNEDGVTSDVKLESNATIDSNLTNQKIFEGVRGEYELTGAINANALEKCRFSIHRPTDFSLFASRATHSAENSFILEHLEKNGDAFKLVTEKTQHTPAVPVAYDFPTASRMSTVWAAQEARNCLEQNDMHSAALLGCAYRIVTKATGAVVLETESDYQYTGVQREYYKVVTANTRASGVRVNGSAGGNGMKKDSRGIINSSSVFLNSGVADRNFGSNANQTFSSGAPLLQGATNGTIAPQSGDTVSIMGVNTAGTVRVNNVANLERLIILLTIAGQIAGIVFGVTLLFLGLFKTVTYHQAVNRLAIGASCLMFGILSPCFVNWLLSASRDVNIFS